MAKSQHRAAVNKLSPEANAVWEAFNQDEAGVFVDYGDKLAAALRALVGANAYEVCGEGWYTLVIDADYIYRVADELDGTSKTSESNRNV